MSQDGNDALKQLWASFTVILALGVCGLGLGAVAAMFPSEPMAEEAAPRDDPKLLALWGFIVLAYLFWLLRSFVWRPYWQFQKVAFPDREKRLILGMLCLTAIPQAVLLGLWLVPVAWIEESLWLVVLFLPLFWYWEWLETRRTIYVERAIRMAGFDYSVDESPKAS